MVLIVGISGSNRPGSTTLTLVNEMLKACEKKGAKIELLDISQIKLPMFDNREGWDYGEEHKRIEALLEKADGFVIGSPEYHGSMSGALKNLLDLLDYTRVVAGKPAAFCAVGGGSKAKSVLDHFLVVARALQIWAVPRVVGANHDDFEKPAWHIKSDKALRRIDEATTELVRAADKLKK